jgi:GDPmannose 4,6-dehydratase
MLQQEEPDDYVIATGVTHSVLDLVKAAFGFLDLDWEKYVKVDERFVRPAEVDLLIGDASKAHKKLAWYPKVTFKELIQLMVSEDLRRLQGK